MHPTEERQAVGPETFGSQRSLFSGLLRSLRFPTLRDRPLAYLLLLPSAVMIFSLIAVPLVQAFYFSFTNKSTLGGHYSFIGLDNYISLFQRPDFPEALRNSIVWTGGNIVLDMSIGLFVALVLHCQFRFRGLARALVLFPYLIPTIVAVLVWRYMLHGLLGVINYWLMDLHLISTPVSWFGSTNRAMMGVIFVGIWKLFPFVVISLLGILQSIPTETYEAARVDGANTIQEFWYITVPSIMPVFVITALLRTIWTWDNFDIIYLLTGGGPVNATTTLPVFVYKEAFRQYRLGRAAAVSVVTFCIMLVLIILYLRLYEKAERVQR
jgi:multiple sugar transport system permease protein